VAQHAAPPAPGIHGGPGKRKGGKNK
jgi:hypothetical protein